MSTIKHVSLPPEENVDDHHSALDKSMNSSSRGGLPRTASRLSTASSTHSNNSSKSSSSIAATSSTSSGGYNIVTDGLPPELAFAAQDLAMQVAAMGQSLTAESIEEAAKNNDTLYREFLRAGATPNEYGELQISLGQFHRHLRSRKLTPTEQLTAIVDLDVVDKFRKTVAGASRRAAAGPGESSFAELANCRLNFNQVSALIRHHTGGPSRRLRAVSLSGAFNPSGVVNFNSSPSMSGFDGGARSMERSFRASPSMTIVVAATQQQQQQQQHRREGSAVSVHGLGGGLDSKDQSQSLSLASEQQHPHHQNQQPGTGAAGNGNSADGDAAEAPGSSHQQQHSAAQQHGSSHNKHYVARGKGGFVAHPTANMANPNLYAQMRAQERASQLAQQQQQQQGGVAFSDAYTSSDQNASGEFLPPNDAEAEFADDGDPLDEDGQPRRGIGYLSFRDEMMAKIERASQSPYRVHNGKPSDSVIPPYMLPGANVKEGFGVMSSEADAAAMAEAQRRNQSPEKRIRKKVSGLTGRAISPDERFRAFQRHQQRTATSRPASAVSTGFARPGSSFSNVSGGVAAVGGGGIRSPVPPRPPSSSCGAGTTRPQTRASARSHGSSNVNINSSSGKRPPSFGYYDWFRSTNRSLPRSAFARGYCSGDTRQQQQRQQQRNDRGDDDVGIYNDDDCDDGDDEADLAFQQHYQQQQNAFTTRSFRPQSSMSTASGSYYNNRAPTSRSRPGSAAVKTAFTNDGENQQQRQQQSRQQQPLPFLAAATDAVLDEVPASLLPERAEVKFAKLHENGAAYMVRPSSAAAATTQTQQQQQNQQRRNDGPVETLSWESRPGSAASMMRQQHQRNDNNSSNNININAAASAPMMFSSNSTTAFDRTLGASELAMFASLVGNGGKSMSGITATATTGGAVILYSDEQPRVRDDDTTAAGLVMMMRAHWATRTIQRWLRKLRFAKHTRIALLVQRLGRGLAARRKVAAIPVRGEDGKQLISRTRLYTLRLQRVGRGYFLARKQLGRQYGAESFDRSIGRFAAQLGLRACLTTASAQQLQKVKQLQSQQQQHHHTPLRRASSATAFSEAGSSTSPFGPHAHSPSASPSSSHLAAAPQPLRPNSLAAQRTATTNSNLLQAGGSAAALSRIASFAAPPPSSAAAASPGAAGGGGASSPPMWNAPTDMWLTAMVNQQQPAAESISGQFYFFGSDEQQQQQQRGVSPSPSSIPTRRPDLVRYEYAMAAAKREQEQQLQEPESHNNSPFFSRSRLKRNQEQLETARLKQEQQEAAAAALAAAAGGGCNNPTGGAAAVAASPASTVSPVRGTSAYHKLERVPSLVPTAEDRQLLRFMRRRSSTLQKKEQQQHQSQQQQQHVPMPRPPLSTLSLQQRLAAASPGGRKSRGHSPVG